MLGSGQSSEAVRGADQQDRVPFCSAVKGLITDLWVGNRIYFLLCVASQLSSFQICRSWHGSHLQRIKQQMLM